MRQPTNNNHQADNNDTQTNNYTNHYQAYNQTDNSTNNQAHNNQANYNCKYKCQGMFTNTEEGYTLCCKPSLTGFSYSSSLPFEIAILTTYLYEVPVSCLQR